ncbi:MAG: formamidopyrimidine-DNA glycosylase [Gammaproteobacteria bacterium]|nr:MAG: formamidopyrimidine-DNA glycosylase [Gammaproteobacteria bacterium]
MPELPEVETTAAGLRPLLCGHRLRGAHIREGRLRRPVPADLDARLRDRPLCALRRRAKYLIFDFPNGHLLIHLGMSGSLRLAPPDTPPRPHDRVLWRFDHGLLCLNDPRRFATVLWTTAPVEAHPLLAALGPEPLGPAFSGAWLHQVSRGRRVAVKSLLMDGRVVAGVGNIYANEALFTAGIHPARPAGAVGRARYARLAAALQTVLTAAIAAGGTTLRDFSDGHGRPGYFQQRLAVYGRAGAPCPRCAAPIRRVVLGQRSTYFCPRCQR